MSQIISSPHQLVSSVVDNVYEKYLKNEYERLDENEYNAMINGESYRICRCPYSKQMIDSLENYGYKIGRDYTIDFISPSNTFEKVSKTNDFSKSM